MCNIYQCNIFIDFIVTNVNFLSVYCIFILHKCNLNVLKLTYVNIFNLFTNIIFFRLTYIYFGTVVHSPTHLFHSSSLPIFLLFHLSNIPSIPFIPFTPSIPLFHFSINDLLFLY